MPPIRRSEESFSAVAGDQTIYTLPVIIFGFAFVLLLAILTDLPLWMVGVAALLALFGYLLERRKSS